MRTITILEWLRSRMLLKKIAALWVLLLCSCFLAKPALLNSGPDIFYLVCLALLMLTTFRLWDDITDRDFDRKHHPKRILAILIDKELIVFHRIGGLLFLLTALLLAVFSSASSLIGFILLAGLMAIVYSLLPTLTLNRTLRTSLVLLKYPAMLILLTGGQLNLRTGLIALGLYGLLLAYECFEYLIKRHDNTT